MITPDGKLLIFADDWRLDWSLPKYQKPAAPAVGMDVGGEFDGSSAMMVASPRRTARFNSNGLLLVSEQPSKEGAWQRFLAVFGPRPKKATLTVEAFFRSVKNSAEELTIVDDRADGYEKAMADAKKGGQEALFEKLTDGLAIARGEAQLVALRATKYVTEENVVRFYKECKKGLRLDWARNFARPIPSEILDKKVAADERGIFDNYAILHFDPEAKSWAESEAEKQEKLKARDPILFGLMKGSTKLYVVGDWEDEFCGLTLEQFAEVVGKKSIETLT
jgi:hypothetical protein